MFATANAGEQLHKTVGVNANRSRIVSDGPPTKRSTKRDVQARQKTWLIEVLDKTKLKPSQLAVGAGVSSSTLTRMLNNDEYSGTLAPETIERIKDTYKVPGPEEYISGGRFSLIGLSEAARLDPRREQNELATVIAAILRGRGNFEAWRLKSMALEGVGYLPGDVLFVRTLKPGETPRPQDAVCAQIVDYQHGAAETVWRVYDPPFLVGASNDRTAYKPVLVDGDRVKISGVVEESYRPHGLSANR